MNTNDLVYKIAERAKQLTNSSMFELRMQVATAENKSAVIQETLGKSKGELVEEILTDEFTEEFPKDIEES